MGAHRTASRASPSGASMTASVGLIGQNTQTQNEHNA